MDDKGKNRRSMSRSSPSTSSSQGDMADTTGPEAGTSHQPSTEQGDDAPQPKKKRTRTLTTPHQSAVLHALLAQSRFPTTAMREEVGRSIGLSARKVQIWFQNQRQKARRPRGQNAPPLTRPPQFGPFPNVPSGSAMSMAPVGAPMQGFGQVIEGRPESGHPSSLISTNPGHAKPDSYGPPDTHFLSSLGRPPSRSMSQLSGPGMPGPSSEHTGVSTRGRTMGSRPRRDSLRSLGHYPDSFPRASTSGETLDMHRLTPRPTRNLPSASMPLSEGDDYPITLPPLQLSRSSSPIAPSTSSGIRSSAYPPLVSAPHSPFDRPRDSFSHIPPPFTLQPRPLWDDPSFSPFNPSRSPPRQPSSYYPPPAPGSHSFSRSPSQPHIPSHPGHLTPGPSMSALPSLPNLTYEGSSSISGPSSGITLAPIRTSRFAPSRPFTSPPGSPLHHPPPTLRRPSHGPLPFSQPGSWRSPDDNVKQEQ